MFVKLKVGDYVFDTEKGKVGYIKSIEGNEATVSQKNEGEEFTSNLSSLKRIYENDEETLSKLTVKKKEVSNPYEMVKEFHKAFNHPVSDKPKVMDFDTAYNRSKWVTEELIEHLAATDVNKLQDIRQQLHDDLDKIIDTEVEKAQNGSNNVLLDQMDALVDQLYFVYGSFVVQGIDPYKPFEIVHNANMDKLENGKIVYKDEEKKKVGKRKGWLPPDKELEKELNNQLSDIDE